MENQILVTHAGKRGATAEIAEKIAEVLQKQGLQTTCLPVNKVNDPDSYAAVVVGSSLYIGRWHKEAVKFLKTNQDSLSQKKTWIFCSGPTGEGDPKELLQGRIMPASLESVIDHIQPRDLAVFHGNLDVNKLNFFERWIIKKVKAPVGDFRDWEAITEWANRIAGDVKNKT